MDYDERIKRWQHDPLRDHGYADGATGGGCTAWFKTGLFGQADDSDSIAPAVELEVLIAANASADLFTDEQGNPSKDLDYLNLVAMVTVGQVRCGKCGSSKDLYPLTEEEIIAFRFISTSTEISTSWLVEEDHGGGRVEIHPQQPKSQQLKFLLDLIDKRVSDWAYYRQVFADLQYKIDRAAEGWIDKDHDACCG